MGVGSRRPPRRGSLALGHVKRDGRRKRKGAVARKERASDKEAQVSTLFVRDLGTYEMS